MHYNDLSITIIVCILLMTTYQIAQGVIFNNERLVRSYSDSLVNTGVMSSPPPNHHYEPLGYIRNSYRRNSFKIKRGLLNINRNDRNNNRRSLSSKTGSNKRIIVQNPQLRLQRRITR